MIYTPKQLELMQLWQNNKLKRINLLEGSVSSGKTWVSLVLWAFEVKTSPEDKAYLMCAKSLTTLKRNCLLLLQELVGERNFTFSLSSKEGRLFGRKVFLEGANDSRSESKIRGMTLQAAYCDELTQFPEDFYTMLLSRLRLPNAKLIATTNPDAPSHWLKTDYIDRQNELDFLDIKFLLDDNPTLPQDYVENLKKEYVGVFYERFILGNWVAAEGLIYPMYEDAIEEPPNEKAEDYQLSIDYGTLNAFACILWGKHKDVWYAEKEYYYSGRAEQALKTDDEYADVIDEYFGAEYNADNKLRVIIDPSAASFITALRRREKYRVIPADNAVVDGIRETASAMSQGFIKISPKLKHWKKEVEGYVWDESCSEDRPVKDNDHCLTGDTLVMTENGEKPISELVGTSGNVWSYNTETGIAELKPYHDCRMTQISAKNIIELKIETGKKIRCTSDHLILTQNGWKQAIECVNERIITFDGNSKYVWGMSECGAEPVYNMEVADNHNFAVNGGLIVHNCMDAMRYFVKTNYIVRKGEKVRKYGE